MTDPAQTPGRLMIRAAVMCLAFVLPLHAQRRPAPPPVPGPPLGDWQSPGRDDGLSRYSPLDQVSTTNVGQLRAVWSFSTGSLRGHEGNPLVVGSMMLVHTPYPNVVYALDLSEPGAPVKWRYVAPLPGPQPRTPTGSAPRIPPLPTGCCDVGSRGLAWHPSGKVYVPLLSGELAALDAATGREIWRVRNADPKLGATLASAPLVAQDLVIVGVSGAEYGVRGYLTAYDAMNGRLVWRGYSTGPDAEVLIDGPANANYVSHQGRDLGVSTWAGDGWRQGGGTASGWISYDSELKLVYYGTDQPAPGNPAQRPGDNKWTSSILARDLATGRVRWALQLTPHDEWGFAGSNENILADLTFRGVPVKALVHFDRNGIAYTVDRGTGRLLVAERFGPANWAHGVDLSSAIPQRDPQYGAPSVSTPTIAGSSARPPSGPVASGICPGSIGTKFLEPAAF
ncbi:MAG TPA: PQQ-binding-like beta-propeller repeat protein, partial [Gemmatimonadales bacterium]|nr:PQQ-binding-like beta-propeller repeat protein [Gemmatimonadales bacterium]